MDINQVDGKAFHDMDPEKAAELGNEVGARVFNNLPYDTGEAVFTPGMAFATDEDLTVDQTEALEKQHSTHVHVSVK